MPHASTQIPADDATPISIADARNPFVLSGAEYWRSLCGKKRFPARTDLTLRGMAPFLRYAVIVGIVEGGRDYEFRYVGDAQREAFGTYFKGMRVSQIEAGAPALGAVLRGVYDLARSTGLAFVLRGRVDHEPPGSKFLYHETAFLPLGASEIAVDHILIVGIQIPEPFWKIPAEKLAALNGASAMSG
jgi:hypothetical protein